MSANGKRLRWAAVVIPAPALQIFLRASVRREVMPRKGRPAAVVAEDKPQALLLEVNEAARRLKILPGMRYASALSLCGDLCAGVVGTQEVECAIDAALRSLQRIAPAVEKFRDRPGVFWLDGSGLERLYPSASAWAREIRRVLEEVEFQAVVVVGWSRFGSYALASSLAATQRLGALENPIRQAIKVFRDADEEKRAVADVPLEHLEIDDALRRSMNRLAVTTIGDFLALPAAGLRERFGEFAWRLHRLAEGGEWNPLRAEVADEPWTSEIDLEPPDGDIYRLLFIIKRRLDFFIDRLVEQSRSLAEIIIEMHFDQGETRCDRLRPAEATNDAAQIIELLRLRMESSLRERRRRTLKVETIRLTVKGVPSSRKQRRLFVENPRRDSSAAGRALARLRAEFGAAAVVRAVVREGHLPEARFQWEPFDEIRLPLAPALEKKSLNLLRRFYHPPLPLPSRSRHLCDEGWLLRGVEHGTVANFVGPHVIDGGWWNRTVHREYHFAEMQSGALFWVFYDRLRRRWFLHGEVR